MATAARIRRSLPGFPGEAQLREHAGHPLREWCEEISTFAELADLYRNYMGGVERGELNIALLNIVALAHALKVRPSKLIEAVP